MCLKPIKLTIFMTELSVPPKLLAPSNYKQNMRAAGVMTWDLWVHFLVQWNLKPSPHQCLQVKQSMWFYLFREGQKELITENSSKRWSAGDHCAIFFPRNSPLSPSKNLQPMTVAVNSSIPKPIWSPLWFILPYTSQSSPSKSSITCNCCRSAGGDPPWNQHP